MLRISLPEIVVLKDCLIGALSLTELDDVVFRLGFKRERIILGDNLDKIFREVVVHFNNRARVDDLIAAARAVNPTDPDLFRFAQGQGLATEFPPQAADAAGLEALIRRHLGMLDAHAWIARAAAAESCVCLIGDEDTPLGTGFLVGPDAVLTNYHVAQRFIQGADPARLTFRFDFTSLPANISATVFRAALPDWPIDHSPLHPSDDPLRHPGTPTNPLAPPAVPADQLDYALLRVAGQPGAHPIGGPLAPAAGAPPRGWLPLSGAAYDFAARPALLVLHHAGGRALQLSIDTDSYAAANAGATRVYHRSNTEPGSSGSPCFDMDWNLVALHQGSATIGGQRLNRAIPTAAIHALLAARGKLGALG